MSTRNTFGQKRHPENKHQNMFTYSLKIGVTLFLIAALTASVLAFVNGITKDRVAENEFKETKKAIEVFFPNLDEIKTLNSSFESPVSAVYEVYSGGKIVGYGIKAEPYGFKDKIGVIVCADTSGKCLGVEITSISDTPGVGTKVREANFLSRFENLDRESIAECDTISGASVSSQAVKKGVLAAMSLDIFGNGDDVQNTEPAGTETETLETQTSDNTSETENGGVVS